MRYPKCESIVLRTGIWKRATCGLMTEYPVVIYKLVIFVCWEMGVTKRPRGCEWILSRNTCEPLQQQLSLTRPTAQKLLLLLVFLKANFTINLSAKLALRETTQGNRKKWQITASTNNVVVLTSYHSQQKTIHSLRRSVLILNFSSS